MISKATVVGAGAMGTCIAQVLASNAIRVSLLTGPQRASELLVSRTNQRYLPGVRLSDRVTPTADPRAAFLQTELVFSAVPTQHLRTTWTPLVTELPADPPVCSCTKGIEVESLLRPSEVLAAVGIRNRLAILSGPSVAPEMGRCLPTTVVVAGVDAVAVDGLQTALSTSWFRVYTSSDPLGVELAGAVKNVIALAAGILDGLRAGDNAKAALVTRGLVEMTRLGVALGARAETFTGLAGIGDLVTTCVSPVGRNRAAGEQIGRGVPLAVVLAQTHSVIEGVPTTRAVLKLAERCGVEMPITQAVADVLFGGVAPLDAITRLMTRPPRAESNVAPTSSPSSGEARS
ncbi:MAG: NAD(P)-dependent glycerol-3-phosphate dehydrogenase [Planctomycetia bacterium]|nr:MAG: NAD(P)-dependent glycerol-3-phosphate dehydrogenase [Planctomycetia bacterium]